MNLCSPGASIIFIRWAVHSEGTVMRQSAQVRYEIGRGLTIGVSEEGDWLISTQEEAFSLTDTTDFYRAWLLFDRPFPEVKAALDEVARGARATRPFPFAKLVGSALRAKSARLADSGITWVSFFTIAEKTSLKDLLVEVKDSKWASQKSRQLARKYVNEILRGKQAGA
jgi:hypothetical protein